MKRASLMFAILASALLASLSFSGEPRSQAQGHFISSLDATVAGLRFFETADGGTPYNKRVYEDRFQKSSSRYISWELSLEYTAPRHRINFEITQKYYRPDGSVLYQTTNDMFFLPPDTTNQYYYGATGWSEPGKWQVGKYRVDLLINGQKVASDSFRIYSSGKEPVKQYVPPEREKPIEDIEINDDLGEL